MGAHNGKSHPAIMIAHTPEAVRARLLAPSAHRYLRDFIYGAIDGGVTTFAVVAGVAGARLPTAVVLVLGFANVVADGFSMAVSNFLGTRAERQMIMRARHTEELHIQRVPEGEREEVRQIYAGKGFAGDDLERAVAVITEDRERWIETMLRDELGLPEAAPSPWRAAAATFGAFVVTGLVPLLAFGVELLTGPGHLNPFVWSSILTALVFFTIGAAKGQLVGQLWYLSGAETLAIGGGAALLAYAFALALRGLTGLD